MYLVFLLCIECIYHVKHFDVITIIKLGTIRKDMAVVYGKPAKHFNQDMCSCLLTYLLMELSAS
jgi:hypothetical protein